MKEGFRQCMAWLHTWTGLTVGWVLYFVFVTGTAGYFAFEIDRWMRPELPLRSTQAVDITDAIDKAQHHLQQVGTGAQNWTIQLPGGRTQPQLDVSWQKPGGTPGQRVRAERATLDPLSGSVVPSDTVRATGGGHLLYRMHYELRYIPYQTAIRLVGICTMFMFIAILTGIVTHKKIFTDFFTFRPGKGQRSWLDAHNLISVTSLPFFLMITYSGLVFFMYQYMPAGVQAVYGMEQAGRQQFQAELSPLERNSNRSRASGQAAPLVPLAPIARQAEQQWGAGQVGSVSVRHPGDAAAVITVRSRTDRNNAVHGATLRFNGTTGEALPEPPTPSGAQQTSSTLLALHEGHFAGPLLRWLYFLAGLLGCAMIATGLVLWTTKRKVQQDKRAKAGQGPAFGFRLVQCLNIGSIAGLPVAVAVYFWANRLIPADFAGRRDWEVHAMFIAWGLMLVYPAVRPALRAWVDELWLAAAAFALLPVLNLFTTERHLGVTVPAGDWVLAGFDLTALALGLCFAWAALRVRRKLQPGAAPARVPRKAATGIEPA
ncbi:PepSY-associated TM helix domain-containing protein [Hydrogenophaga palleronii]|uniref:PepSY-associated TM helix domain-containing protein n=1 Tax=Hydrogenophaga palleronii TaxID=65655 RepID=UPI00082697E5|nr:PepSY-associated TM helix domain-containing protein [Hydrogenophaga palleronii]